MDHLLGEKVITQKEYETIRNCTTVKLQTAQLIDLVLANGNAAAEVFRNWIKKNDVYLLRELMGISVQHVFIFSVLCVCPSGIVLSSMWDFLTSNFCY